MLFDVVLFGILSCDLLVTVSLFESNLKVPKQDGSVLWKTASGDGFLYRNGSGMETALACAAGISGVAGVGAASMAMAAMGCNMFH